MSPVLVPLILVLGTPGHRCARDPDALVVEPGPRLLHLCRSDGLPEASYRVSLGRGGLDKSREGDRKTPVGRYPLGRPRPSRSGFDTFIPVGYPTAEQRAEGRTGSAIGVHGPPQNVPQPLAAVGVFIGNWTNGCIAVAEVDVIRQIAVWVRVFAIETIVIDPLP